MSTTNIVDKYSKPKPNMWAVGWIAFAAVAMIILGIFHALAGLTAIVDDDFYVIAEGWLFEFDVTVWGWIHLLGGVVVAAAGFGLFTGSHTARIVGIVVAGLSAITAFAWLPSYPVWGVIKIGFATAILWALTTHGADLAREQNMVD